MVKAEQRVDLSGIAGLPNMANAFAEGYLEWGKLNNLVSRRQKAYCLLKGWNTFLIENDFQQLSINDITTSLVNLFVNWLDQEANGKQRWSVKTRLDFFAGLTAILEKIKVHPKWRDLVSKELYINSPWSNSSRRGKPRTVLPHELLHFIYKACENEVIETMAEMEAGWSQLAVVEKNFETRDASTLDFRNRWECLHYVRRKYDGVLPYWGLIKSGDPHLARKLKEYYGGWNNLSRFWIPNARDFVPFALLLGIHFAYNPDALLQSELRDYETYQILGENRIRGNVFKGRAGRRQRRTMPITTDPDNPAVLISFVKRWTEWIRTFSHPSLQDRLFLFARVHTIDDEVEIISYGHEKLGAAGSSFWISHLKAFIRENNLDDFSLAQIRTTVLDYAHELFGGDLRAVKAVGQQQSPQIITSHYTSDAAKQRNDEKLAGVMALRNRYRQTNGRVDSRSLHADEDVGCATPGWSCLDPYSGPISLRTDDNLCFALGWCPICPHANANLESPYVCARVHQLFEEIRILQTHIMPQAWLSKWAPIADRLLTYWMPKFSNKVVEDSRLIAETLPPFPPLE
ncbi:MAG: hypothetical protein KJ899_06110 [Gammaproteobacteria bacterium]|nr:hypothetical protein [Gammaproteobacteria bacterium]